MINDSITPPPELVARWKDHWFDTKIKHINLEDYILAQAAQWGADQELEACVKWIEDCGYYPSVPKDFRAARRPNPLSLKEKALELAKPAGIAGAYVTFGPEELDTIRRALEALPND